MIRAIRVEVPLVLEFPRGEVRAEPGDYVVLIGEKIGVVDKETLRQLPFQLEIERGVSR